MESWSLNRQHRFKNLLAFLILSFEHLPNFDSCLHNISPLTLETAYLRYLGNELPTEYEYNFGLTTKMVQIFDGYCYRWLENE